jgi:hypothetical protein
VQVNVEIDPTISIDPSKLDKAAECIQGITEEISLDTGFTLLRSMIAHGLLNKQKKDPRSLEQRIEAEEAAERVRAKVIEYLKNHEGPTYHRDLNNGLTLLQVLDKIGLEKTSSNMGIVLAVLRTESTGWGLVDYIGDHNAKNKKPVFGKKATLLGFRQAA